MLLAPFFNGEELMDVINNGLAAKSMSVVSNSVPSSPIQEISQTTGEVDLGTASNVPFRISKLVEAGTLIQPSLQTPAKNYDSNRDASGAYISLLNEDGFNGSTSTNDDRTQVVAYQARVINNGQGDAAAFSGLAVVNTQRAGATHWLASPAGILFNGTSAVQAHGGYANPLELYLHDTPSSPKRATMIGPVIRIDRNLATQPKGAGGTVETGGIGEVCFSFRALSVGAEYVDNILSGTGKFFGGIDFSMPSLDFGTNKAAIALKAEDRLYFNTSAQQVDDSSIFIRSEMRATTQFTDYITYKTDLGTPRLATFVGGVEGINQTATAWNANVQLNANGGVYIKTGFKLNVGGQGVVGARQTGFSLWTGTADGSSHATYTAPTISATPTQSEVQAIADAVQNVTRGYKKLLDALHITSSGHGLIGA